VLQRTGLVPNAASAENKSGTQARCDRASNILRQAASQPNPRPVRLSALARELGVSAGYLSRQFKREFGVSFRSLALRARQAHAANLLESTDLLVKEIAAQAGYRHVSDFSTSFRKIHQMSPTAYRKQVSREQRPPWIFAAC
jgi:AraC-like DNA-binding protein